MTNVNAGTDVPDQGRKRIFFCDFDGTLANQERNISPRTRAALDSFAARGNIFVLSSGRAMPDVKNLAKRLELHYPGMYLSAWNGGEIYSCETGKTFFREYLTFDVVREVMQMAQENRLYCQTYDVDDIVIPEWGREADYYTTFVKMPVRVNETVRTNPAAVLAQEPCKCLVIHLENQEDHALEAFSKQVDARFGDTVRTILSNPWYLEVDPIRATKANALRFICSYLGIDIADSVAAGDAPNDNSMIEAAGLGIGMCNGLATNPEMADIADIITKADNNHDGLADILDTL